MLTGLIGQITKVTIGSRVKSWWGQFFFFLVYWLVGPARIFNISSLSIGQDLGLGERAFSCLTFAFVDRTVGLVLVNSKDFWQTFSLDRASFGSWQKCLLFPNSCLCWQDREPCLGELQGFLAQLTKGEKGKKSSGWKAIFFWKDQGPWRDPMTCHNHIIHHGGTRSTRDSEGHFQPDYIGRQRWKWVLPKGHVLSKGSRSMVGSPLWTTIGPVAPTRDVVWSQPWILT